MSLLTRLKRETKKILPLALIAGATYSLLKELDVYVSKFIEKGIMKKHL